MTDPLARLDTLRTAEPSAARACRIKAMAHRELQQTAARARRRDAGDGGRRSAVSPLWLGAAASLGLVYVAEVVYLAAGVLASR